MLWEMKLPKKNQSILFSSVKDNIKAHFVSPRKLNADHEKTTISEATASKVLLINQNSVENDKTLDVTFPKTTSDNYGESSSSKLTARKGPLINQRFPENDKILNNSFLKMTSDKYGESSCSNLTTQSSPEHLPKNKNEFRLPPLKSPTEVGQLNDSKGKFHSLGTPQCTQRNEIVSSDSSTYIIEGSKDSKTSFPELLQLAQKNKSSVHSASPSTSELSEQVKVECEASPSLTQSKIKLSYQLSKRPNKFSINGSPVSSPKNHNFYSNTNKSPKGVNQISPLSFTRNKFPEKHLPNARGVKRKLNFSNNVSEESSSVEKDDNPANENLLGTQLSEVISQFTDAFLLRQFKLHIDLVLEDSSSRGLINDQEMDLIRLFCDMNSECQDLYARMHNRKYKWNRLEDIKYAAATMDNLCILEEKGFVVTDMKNVPIADVLNLLKITQLKELCKSLGIKSTQNKNNYCKEIMNYCQSQKTLGFQLQFASSEEVVKQKIKQILGPCFILSPEPRGLFRRIHVLFNLKFNRNEQSRYGSQDLFEIQFVGTEKALYPKCSIDKTAKVFTSREDLLKFQTAEDLKIDYLSAVVSKDLNKAEAVLNIVRNNFISEFDFITNIDESPRISASTLPLSLRKFTPGTVYAYVLSEGVEVLKKLKKKETAVNDLLLLLDQTTFLPYMRGRWYEKLMTLHRTAGEHKEVAKTICKGMKDRHVDDQGAYIMSCRSRELMKKKCKSVDEEIKLMLIDVRLLPELQSCKRTEIRACALDGKSGYKRVYIQDDETGDGKKYSSVEELVKSHYCPNMFKQGMHAENSLISSLFGILFWDIIYEYHVPCAFISPYQTRPLDLSTGEFYKNRQQVIDTRLIEMSKWTNDDVSSWVADVYSKHSCKSSVVNWKWFSNSTDIVNIIKCIGLQVLSKVCERYAKKYRGVRSGFPDLFLWSPGEKDKYKFVEVKGPNDTLSPNQKLWLDFLVKINANVEVCAVVAKGSKTLKATSALEPDSTFGAIEIDEM